MFGFTNIGDVILLGIFIIGTSLDINAGTDGFLLRLLLRLFGLLFASFGFSFGAFQAFEVDYVVASATATRTMWLENWNLLFMSLRFIEKHVCIEFQVKLNQSHRGAHEDNDRLFFIPIQWLIESERDLFCCFSSHTPKHSTTPKSY